MDLVFHHYIYHKYNDETPNPYAGRIISKGEYLLDNR